MMKFSNNSHRNFKFCSF